MRKSFTRLIGVFALIFAFGFQVMAQGTFDGTKSTPKDNATNVKPADVATQFVIAFTGAPSITEAGGSMIVYSEGGQVVKVIPVNRTNANLSVVGNTIVVTHGITTIKEETNYYVTLTAGAVTLGANNSPVSLTGTEAWNFTTGDFTAPVLASENPLAPKGAGVKATMSIAGNTPEVFNLTLKFNEDVVLGKGNIAIYQENGTVVELLSVSASNTTISGKTATVTVDADARFLPETNYYVFVDAGAFTDNVSAYGEDAKANAYAGLKTKTTWTFTTRDNTAPAVTLAVTEVAKTTAKLNVTLSEDGSFHWYVRVKGGATVSDAAVADVDGGVTKTVSVTGLTQGVEYEAYVVASNDLTPANVTTMDEALEGKKAFRTDDGAAPVGDYAPNFVVVANGKTTGAFMYFDEEVTGGAGTLSVRNRENNALAAELDASTVTSVKVTKDGDPYKGKYKVTFDFGVELASATAYYIVFPNGFIVDMSGNKYENPTSSGDAVPVSATSWVINSADFEAPVAKFATTSKTTATTGNITGAGAADVIFINFDEPVVLKSGDAWPASANSDYAFWTRFVSIKKGGANVPATFFYNATEDRLEIDVVGDLTNNTTYDVRLYASVVKDASNNVMTAEKAFSVTAGDNATAEYTYSTGDLGATSALKIDFSKDAFIKDGDNLTAITAASIKAKLTVTIGSTTLAADKYTVALDEAKDIISVTPVDPWPTSTHGVTTKTVTLAFNKTNVVDSKKAAFAGNANATWNVKDYTAPTVTLLSGNVTLDKINTELGGATVTFNEAVSSTIASDPTLLSQFTLKKGDASGENVTFTLSWDAANKVATLDAGTFAEGTYYYGVGATYKDGANNKAAATYGTFTVVANPVPATLTAVSYKINGGTAITINGEEKATNVEKNTNDNVVVEITFNQNIDDNTLTDVRFVKVGTTDTTMVDVTSANFNGTKLTVTIVNPTFEGATPGSIDPGSTYAFIVPRELVESNEQVGGEFLSMSNDLVLTLVTKDMKDPAIDSQSPAADATIVLDPTKWNADHGLVFNFDEKVNIGSGKIVFQSATTNGQKVEVIVNNSNISLNEARTKAVVTVPALVEYNTVYNVTVPATAFEDDTENDLGAAVAFAYTTVVNDQPAIAMKDGAINVTPANGADLVPTSATLVMNFTEAVKIPTALSSRKVIYVIEQKGDSPAATWEDAVDYDLDVNGDAVVFNKYVEQTEFVHIDGNTVSVTGVTLEANKKYYVMITPGAFIDLSKGITFGTEGNADYRPVPGVFAGMENNVWSFTTANVNQPAITLDFSSKGADEKVATNSNILINFSKPVVDFSGNAIVNVNIPTMVKLYRVVDGGTDIEIEFTGNLSADKQTITIDNGSLVDEELGSLVGETTYRVEVLTDKFKVENSSIVVAPVNRTFETSDYVAPTKPVITFNGGEIAAVSVIEGAHTAKLVLADAAANDDVTALYYLWTADVSATYTAASVKDNGIMVKASAAPKNLTFNENMVSGTEYRVVAVAIDENENLSEVTSFKYKTDDNVAPELEGDLPTTFGENDNLVLVFNEAVVPAASAYARIIDANGVVYQAPIANLTGDNAAANKISINIDAAGLPLSEDVATYTVEIDKGMIVDVPRDTDPNTGIQAANDPNPFAGILGSSFSVMTDDGVAPTLASLKKSGGLNPVFTAKFSEPVKLNNTFTQYVIYDVTGGMTVKELMKSAALPYDVLTAEDIEGAETNTLTMTANRAVVSGRTYRLVVVKSTISDMAGQKWAASGDEILEFTAEDVIALDPTFQLNFDMAPTVVNLPLENASTRVPEAVTINFGEDFFMNHEDAINNTTELMNHVYVKVNDEAVAFSIVENNAQSIKLAVAGTTDNAGFSAYKGQTVTFGFMNLKDAAGNLNEGEFASFEIATDAAVVKAVKFIPGDNDGNATTKVNIGVHQDFTLEFTGIIYSYHADSEELNNLIVNAQWLQTNNVFTLTGTLPEGAEMVVSSYEEVEGKSIVTLNVEGNLLSKQDYTLTVVANKIQIGQGDENVIATAYTETFRTADVVAPKLIMADGEIDVDAYAPRSGGIATKDGKLALIFDEEVVGADTMMIHRWDGVVVAKVDLTGVKSTKVDGTTTYKMVVADIATVMTANSTFVTDEAYYVIVPAGAVVDKAATPNAFAGITTINQWAFDLRDDNMPVPTFLNQDATNVPVSADIAISFDREVVSTDGKGWLAVYEEGNREAVQLIRIEDDIDPVAATEAYTFDIATLKPNTKYFVELGAGSFALAVDNSILQEQVNIGDWWFTTEGDAKPEVVTLSPAHEETLTYGVALDANLVVTFDQDVQAGSGMIQLHNRKLVGDEIVTTFDVTDATKVVFEGATMTIASEHLGLVENAEYYVIIPATAVSNTTSTPDFWDGITTPLAWSFSTIQDGTAPVLSSFTPQDTITGTHPEFVMTFEADVTLTEEGGSLIVTEKDSTEAKLTIELTADMISGNIVTVAYDTTDMGLNINTTYHVTVSANSLENEVGNPWEGVTDDSWSFTTGPEFTTPVEPVIPTAEFKVYPNPFNDNIKIDNFDKLTRVVITNIAGQRVLDIEYPSYEIRTANLVTGVYVISLFTEDGMAKSERIVKR